MITTRALFTSKVIECGVELQTAKTYPACVMLYCHHNFFYDLVRLVEVAVRCFFTTIVLYAAGSRRNGF